MYSSLGTAFNNWPEYYPILFDAVRDLDVNVFAALGAINPDSLTDIPDNVEVGQMVPQLDILSQASVFITHAGMGGAVSAGQYEGGCGEGGRGPCRMDFTTGGPYSRGS